ncbi:1-acyl-sn-glycerol-3-phosphate acyltransferase [Nocardia sp. CA2R105]|nr:1-acyl-sn-glycerol-3-phosphate acyltransferase [Nocardia coffeae]
MPSSPCVPSCVETEAEVGSLRVAGRVLGAFGLLFTFPVVNLVTPRSRRKGLHRGYARAVLRCCGIGLRVVDERGVNSGSANAEGEDKALLNVAGHVGWTDVIALAAVQPMGFVARADLIDWPVLGGLARLMRVIPIERERLRALPEVIDAIAARLSAGERVAMFPEGTTWCGRAHGRMRPALFQAAVDTGTAVQPIRVRYLDRTGELSTVPGFVGVDTFLDSVGRVLHARGVVAEITLLPAESAGDDRHDLARRCERAIRGDETPAIDARATALGTGPTRKIVSDNDIHHPVEVA